MCVQIAALSGSTCCSNISTLFNTSSIYSPQRRIKYYCIIVVKLMLLLQPNSPPFAMLLLLFVVVSPIQRIGCQPEKLLNTVTNPARGLLNREKRTKEKVWQHTPPPTPHTARSEKINYFMRRIYRRYAGLGRFRVRTRIPSARRLGLWVWLREILHSRLRLQVSQSRCFSLLLAMSSRVYLFVSVKLDIMST